MYMIFAGAPCLFWVIYWICKKPDVLWAALTWKYCGDPLDWLLNTVMLYFFLQAITTFAYLLCRIF